MDLSLKKELPLMGIALFPIIYLMYVWKSLPEKVPLHWNYKGEIDNWGDKSSLIYLVLLLPILTYVLFLLIPKLDPKNKIALMGGKYYQLKFIFVLLMSFLALFITYMAKNQSFSSPNLIFASIAILFIALGNYFKTIRPNYFIGIRTPWTLENEEVWKNTHNLAAKYWVIGGLLLLFGSLLLPSDWMGTFFLSVTIVIILVPTVYSYFNYKKLKKGI